MKGEAELLAGKIVQAAETVASPAAPGGDSGFIGASARRNVVEPAQVPERMIARSVLGLTPADYRSTTAYITKTMVNFFTHCCEGPGK